MARQQSFPKTVFVRWEDDSDEPFLIARTADELKVDDEANGAVFGRYELVGRSVYRRVATMEEL